MFPVLAILVQMTKPVHSREPLNRGTSCIRDILASPEVNGAIVALGDSITDGVDSRPDQYERWTDVLARRLLDSKHVLSLLNAGIAGNRVLSNSPCWGTNAIARLDRDVF